MSQNIAENQPSLPHSDGFSIGAWRSAWASVAGSAHQQRGLACDDAIFAETLPCAGQSLWFCVICDGAGSAAYGAEAAQCASTSTRNAWQTWIQNTERVREKKPELIWSQNLQQTMKSWAEAAQADLHKLASDRNTKLREFACTWICVVASADELFVAQIGDGAVVWFDGSNWCVSVWPVQGEYANTTIFLFDPQATSKMEFFQTQTKVDTIIGFSDGLQRLALQYNEKKAFQGFLNPLMNSFISAGIGDEKRWAEQLAAWLDSAQVNARTDDDKTFVIARRSE